MAADTRPLRICLGVPYLAPYSKTNGIAWYNRWLADGLVKKGHAVKVVDLSLLEPQPAVEPWGETVVMRGPRRAALPKSLRTAMFMRKYLASHERFDIFETSNWPGLAALRPRTTAVTFVRLITPSGRAGIGNLQNAVCNALEAISVHRADATIASTSYIRDALSKLYKVDLARAYRVSFGIPDVEVARSGSIDGPMRFISVGRAEARKGSDVLLASLLQAFGRRDDFEVTLVGAYDGFANGSPELQRMWTALRTAYAHRLTVVENIAEERKHELLAASDYLLMTSRAESFGLPVIEAMRAGTAVISSAGGGLREVAGACAGNVLYDDPEDPDLLAAAIVSAVQRGRLDAIERGRLARRTYLERFHEDVFIEGTVHAYRDRLERKRFAQAR